MNRSQVQDARSRAMQAGFLRPGLLATPVARYALAVLAPALLIALYLGLWASEGYVSRAQLVVEQDNPNGVASGAEMALGLLSAGGGKSKQDALLVRDFMLSRTMLEYLDKELNLREHFSGGEIDWWSRLDSAASAEEFLDYYQSRLSAVVDEESLILQIEFVAFDPVFAQAVTEKLVDRSEVFVNEVSRQLAKQQLVFMDEQVNLAHLRLKKASREMIELQRQNEVFSPEKESEAVGEILAGLEVELSQQRTHLKALLGFLNADAPDVVAVLQRISALEEQLEQERARLVGQESPGLNDMMLAYQDAEVNLRLATEVYKSALASLESTRLDAVRKVKYLISVDRPSLPDSAEQPRVAYWVATIFVMLNLIYFVVNLIAATIQDHRE